MAHAVSAHRQPRAGTYLALQLLELARCDLLRQPLLVHRARRPRVQQALRRQLLQLGAHANSLPAHALSLLLRLSRHALRRPRSQRERRDAGIHLGPSPLRLPQPLPQRARSLLRCGQSLFRLASKTGRRCRRLLCVLCATAGERGHRGQPTLGRVQRCRSCAPLLLRLLHRSAPLRLPLLRPLLHRLLGLGKGAGHRRLPRSLLLQSIARLLQAGGRLHRG